VAAEQAPRAISIVSFADLSIWNFVFTLRPKGCKAHEVIDIHRKNSYSKPWWHADIIVVLGGIGWGIVKQQGQVTAGHFPGSVLDFPPGVLQVKMMVADYLDLNPEDKKLAMAKKW